LFSVCLGKYTGIKDNPFIAGDTLAFRQLIADLSSEVKQEVKEEEPVEIQTVTDTVFPPDPISILNDEDDCSELQLSEQIPLSYNAPDDDDDWQPPQGSSDANSSTSSDLENSTALPTSTKPKRRKKAGKPTSKYQCSTCHQILSGPHHLRRHLAIRHNIGFQKRYPCNIPGCSKAFENSHKLVLHKKSTSHEKRALHKCRHCGKGNKKLN